MNSDLYDWPTWCVGKKSPESICSVSGREGQVEVEEQVRVAELGREGGIGATSCI